MMTAGAAPRLRALLSHGHFDLRREALFALCLLANDPSLIEAAVGGDGVVVREAVSLLRAPDVQVLPPEKVEGVWGRVD